MTPQHGLRCTHCGEDIYSNSRHDFVSCSCEAIFIDGGFDYIRAGGDLDGMTDVWRSVDRTTLPRRFRDERPLA